MTNNSDVFPLPSLRLVVVVVAAAEAVVLIITTNRSFCLHENRGMEEHSVLEVCLGI